MKILLYYDDHKRISQSGIGTALRHQTKALSLVGIETTYDPNDSFDIAHINTYLPKSKALLLKCKRKHIPVIVHGHSTIEDFKNSFRHWKLWSIYYNRNLVWFYRHADRIITPTEYSKKLIQNYKVKCPIDVVSNGVNIEDYKINYDMQDQFKKTFNITNEKVVIGVGFPFERKGILDFIEVARRMPNIRFIWFGSLKEKLTSKKILKAMKNLPTNCELPGFYSNSFLIGAYQTADCFFFPSYEETEGIVVLEALASSCPILIRDIGVYNPQLKNRINCYKGNNNGEFIQLIKEIVDHKDANIINNGLELAKQYDLHIIGEELKQIYTKTKK